MVHGMRLETRVKMMFDSEQKRVNTSSVSRVYQAYILKEKMCETIFGSPRSFLHSHCSFIKVIETEENYNFTFITLCEQNGEF